MVTPVERSPGEQILLLLGRGNQVKYPTLLENIERCDTLAIDSEDVEQLISSLLELTEQVSDLHYEPKISPKLGMESRVRKILPCYLRNWKVVTKLIVRNSHVTRTYHTYMIDYL